MIDTFLKELRESADVQYTIFTQGSCFRLYTILKIISPKAQPYWSERDGHCITKIKGKYYDIGGEIGKAYKEEAGYCKIPKNQLKGYGLLKYANTEESQLRVVTEKYIKT